MKVVCGVVLGLLVLAIIGFLVYLDSASWTLDVHFRSLRVPASVGALFALVFIFASVCIFILAERSRRKGGPPTAP
jgi:hypothetical protein